MDSFDLRLNYFVYPGQPLVSAYYILTLFDKLSDAIKTTEWGYPEAETRSEIPGAGGVATDALNALKQYTTPMILAAHLHYYWIRLTGPRTGNFQDRFAEGLEKALNLEQEFYRLLSEKEKAGFFDVK